MALEPFSVALLEPGDGLDPAAWILCAKCILSVEPQSCRRDAGKEHETPAASQVALRVKNPPADGGDIRHRFDPWVGKIP